MVQQLTHGLQIYTHANAHQQDFGEVHADIGLGRSILLLIILRDDGIVNFLDTDSWSSVLLRSQLSSQRIFMGGFTTYHQPEGDFF